MGSAIIDRSPIPLGTIILWDAKYRKEGGYYPKFKRTNLIRWKPDILAALFAPARLSPVTLCGSDFRHLNGQIGECNSYRVLLANGHYGIQGPGRTSASGPDYITYFHGSEIFGDATPLIIDALAHQRIVGRIFRWPECIVTD